MPYWKALENVQDCDSVASVQSVMPSRNPIHRKRTCAKPSYAILVAPSFTLSAHNSIQGVSRLQSYLTYQIKKEKSFLATT